MKNIKFSISYLLFVIAFPQICLPQNSNRAGSSEEPVRILTNGIDMDVHDGGLRPAIGVENIQVLRANRKNPKIADNYGWTYNHAPNIAYWNDKFYLQYLSNPFAEHMEPGHTLVATSNDGRTWDVPEVVFPIYYLRPGPIRTHDTGMAMMHQRMGFYVAPNGKLLVVGFYGHAPNLWGEGGIGRVVREVFLDGSYGPIYFIRYNSLSNYDENNTNYPFYTASEDQEFISACDALLSDKLKTMQWWEEDRSNDGFYSVTGRQAPSVYHRKDGTAVVHWKSSWAALSTDQGETWSKPVQLPSLITSGAKTWGQRTVDDRFALIYNPTPDGSHRWPLAVVTSDDGILFDNMLLIHGEVPPLRYVGRAKDFGPQYVRGISEGNGIPPTNDMWLTYSVNKEDIWISRVPVPIKYKINSPVKDLFDELLIGGRIPDWNIYRTQLASVEIVDFPSSENKSLSLKDSDPYDYAKAVRVFKESDSVRISFQVLTQQSDYGRLEIEVLDYAGDSAVQIVFDEAGHVFVNNPINTIAEKRYEPNLWYQIEIAINTSNGKFDFSIDNKMIVRQGEIAESVLSVERLSFRTGKYRTDPTRQMDRYEGFEDGDLAAIDESIPLAVYFINDVIIN